MSINNLYQIAGATMNAQTTRLNSIASNMANADVAAGSAEQAFRAIKPVFATIYQQQSPNFNQEFGAPQLLNASVKVAQMVESDAPLEKRYQPDHPLANEDGFIFLPNINMVEEMADMMSASRSFESGVEIMNRAKSMQQGLLKLGQ
ncbi:flagellar basal body rod protein FlgC [Paraferrimonas sp. SM1919]|uniref:flagellar basal body rod protein FlgC n=1 Tax=Paraferrimonas sp. SM1919 TaxID=2662263 RepID=UPI0013D76374|nr:flagellar basal body rod protein FlgC [Paraferrimonas sp. SM1919]